MSAADLQTSPLTAPIVDSGIAPTASRLTAVAATAVLLRVLLFVVASHLGGWTIDSFASLRDGPSYMHIAAAILGDSSQVTAYDRRVFLGYPTIIAAVSVLGIPIPIAALMINWVCAGATAVLSAVLFRDMRVGWAVALFPPSYLTYSTLVMNESSLLAFSVGGLVLARKGRPVSGGLLLGFAGLVRPVACFAVLGMMTERLARKRQRDALLVGAVSALVVLSGYLILQSRSGNALVGVQTYVSDERAFGGQPFALPFQSLLLTPVRHSVPLWKVAYAWSYVALTIAGCILAVREVRGGAVEDHDRNLLAATWLISNTLFVLCIGNVWGFHDFNRHILAALPALMWTFRAWARRGRIAMFTASVSVALGVVGLLRSG
jgi:hypothetical protein